MLVPEFITMPIFCMIDFTVVSIRCRLKETMTETSENESKTAIYNVHVPATCIKFILKIA
jgi:hypothetical protein